MRGLVNSKRKEYLVFVLRDMPNFTLLCNFFHKDISYMHGAFLKSFCGFLLFGLAPSYHHMSIWFWHQYVFYFFHQTQQESWEIEIKTTYTLLKSIHDDFCMIPISLLSVELEINIRRKLDKIDSRDSEFMKLSL